jgi:glycosyltransferase involved in cell wall biosynthesis
MGKPLIWSPRGALQATHDWPDAPKRSAKRWFEKMLNALRPADMVMHVTAAQEAQTSVSQFAGMATCLIPNAVDVPLLVAPKVRPQGRTRLISLGRLHPKKGLLGLIDTMMVLPAQFTLDIYGSGDAAYTAQLHHAAAPLGNRVRFHGHVDDAGKAKAFAGADLFVLPSQSENFGIAVAEALAHGVPVLMTHRTPWQAVDVKGCGRCIDMEQADLAFEIAGLAQQDLAVMGARGRNWIAQEFSTQTMVAQFDALYREMAAAQTQRVLA